MSGAVPKKELSRDERLFYRDRLRAARYAALADAEGFEHICFAVESLGMRLLGKQAALGKGRPRHEGYENYVLKLADAVSDKRLLAEKFPGFFTRFPALYTKLRKARNDAMHTGAFARHATSAAIELCIHLEEAVMKDGDSSLDKVSDRMVREVVKLEAWRPRRPRKAVDADALFFFSSRAAQWEVEIDLRNVAGELPPQRKRPPRPVGDVYPGRRHRRTKFGVLCKGSAG